MTVKMSGKIFYEWKKICFLCHFDIWTTVTHFFKRIIYICLVTETKEHSIQTISDTFMLWRIAYNTLMGVLHFPDKSFLITYRFRKTASALREIRKNHYLKEFNVIHTF